MSETVAVLPKLPDTRFLPPSLLSHPGVRVAALRGTLAVAAPPHALRRRGELVIPATDWIPSSARAAHSLAGTAERRKTSDR